MSFEEGTDAGGAGAEGQGEGQGEGGEGEGEGEQLVEPRAGRQAQPTDLETKREFSDWRGDGRWALGTVCWGLIGPRRSSPRRTGSTCRDLGPGGFRRNCWLMPDTDNG